MVPPGGVPTEGDAASLLDDAEHALASCSFVTAERTATLALAATAEMQTRARILLVRSAARHLAGDIPGMKEDAYQAAEAARAADAPTLFAHAAVLHGRWVVVGTPDRLVVDLCEEALGMLGDGEIAWRARILATLANFDTFARSAPAQATALAETALALARRCGDEFALAEALYQAAVSLLPTARFDERLAYVEELAALGDRTGDPDAALNGLLLRAGERLQVGDVPGVRADATALAALGRRLRWWAASYWARAIEITLATFEGRLADARAGADALYGEAAERFNAFDVYAAQIFAIAHEEGALGDLVPPLISAVDNAPRIVAFRTALAAALAQAGQIREARIHLERLLADGFRSVDRDQAWLVSMAMLAEVAHLVGDPSGSTALAELLEPFGGRLVVGGIAVVCIGAVDRYRGLLAAAAGDRAAADAAFAAAAELETRAGSAAAAARTRAAWDSARG